MTQPDVGARERDEPEAEVRADGSAANHDHITAGSASPDSASPDSASAGSASTGSASTGSASPDRATTDSTSPGSARPDSSPADAGQPQLPPGQYIPRTMPVLHYGPIPTFHAETWDLRIFGATESGAETQLRWDDVAALPTADITGDFHCVTKFTVPGISWSGIPATELLRRYPPKSSVTHVMIWADFGYSANVRISDFAAELTMLATHREGERLTPEHGFPLRLVMPHLYAWKSVKWVRAVEYMTADRRGFWEERGYHNTADPWQEQRYSYQELEGEGPPL